MKPTSIHQEGRSVPTVGTLATRLSPPPPGTAVHIVLDNCATHRTPAVRRWLAKRPQYQLHFTPTSVSGLNQVERLFADLTAKQLRRGVFNSVASLEKAATDYIDARNERLRGVLRGSGVS